MSFPPLKLLYQRNAQTAKDKAFVDRMYHQYQARILQMKTLYVFGYGSLIWKPDFNPVSIKRARVKGYRRDFSLYSVAYRGTIDNPGLILGLDLGGTCTGLLYEVAARDKMQVADMLWQREMITIAYNPTLVPAYVGRCYYPALCFTTNVYHSQYARGISFADKIHMLRTAKGSMGSNLEYAKNTVDSLTHHNITDSNMAKIIKAVGSL